MAVEVSVTSEAWSSLPGDLRPIPRTPAPMLWFGQPRYHGHLVGKRQGPHHRRVPLRPGRDRTVLQPRARLGPTTAQLTFRGHASTHERQLSPRHVETRQTPATEQGSPGDPAVQGWGGRGKRRWAWGA